MILDMHFENIFLKDLTFYAFYIVITTLASMSGVVHGAYEKLSQAVLASGAGLAYAACGGTGGGGVSGVAVTGVDRPRGVAGGVVGAARFVVFSKYLDTEL